MRSHHQAVRRPMRAGGRLAAAALLAAVVSAAAAPAALAGTAAHAGQAGQAGQAGPPGAPEVAQVTSGPARSLGEPAAAKDGAVSAVIATRFGGAGSRASVWTRPAGTATWRPAGTVQPAGFGSSYDPAAAAVPGGPLLLVAGTAPPGGNCIAGGSVAIASVDSRGRLGAARLVSDQRGTGSFDDRPMVAAGQHGLVWVAWSQGPDADACQNVGRGDRIEVAVSRDGGQTFGTPVALPADGGDSAFGVRLAPLAGGQVAVSWTETMPNGDQGVLVSLLGADGHPRAPAIALAGDGLPLVLPGASFYDFPAGDIAALPDGTLAVAAPFWVSGRAVIRVAVGVPGGPWRAASLSPPAGADLLLPALGVLSPGGLRLLYAVHTRHDDRLGYAWTSVSTAGPGAVAGFGAPAALTQSPPGPGFFEIGEELALTPAPGGLLTAVVVAGDDGASLRTAAFPAAAPAAASSGPAGTPGAASQASSPAMPGRGAAGTSAARTAGGWLSGAAATAAWAAAAALCCAAAAGAVLLRRRRLRAARLRAARYQAARHQAPRTGRPAPGRERRTR